MGVYCVKVLGLLLCLSNVSLGGYWLGMWYVVFNLFVLVFVLMFGLIDVWVNCYCLFRLFDYV